MSAGRWLVVEAFDCYTPTGPFNFGFFSLEGVTGLPPWLRTPRAPDASGS